MPTENILIKFTSDLSGLKSASDELVKMGKLTEEDKKKFDTLLGTIEGIDDALKEAGIEAGKFSKEVAKGADSGKSLRGQLADAKNEAVRLSQAFGPFSKEAREAAKRAAEIKDEIADLNDTLDALNPEAKLNAFVKLGQGVQGAFQVATGALQVFGVENERITKLAQQFQGVLNVTQGINSVLQLKDVYTQLRLVLGITTAAQEGLKAATIATTVAEEGAVVATNTLNASLKSLALTAGPIILAFAAIIAVIDQLFDAYEAAAKSSEDLRKAEEQRLKILDAIADGFLELVGGNQKLLEIEKERGATELDLLKIRLQQLETDEEFLRLALAKAQTNEKINEITKKLTDTLDDQLIIQLKIGNEVKRLVLERLKAAQVQRDIEAAATKALESQFNAEFQARLTAADKTLALSKMVNDLQSKSTNDRIKNDLVSELAALDVKRDAYIQFAKDTEEIDLQIALVKKRLRDQEIKEEEELTKKIKDEQEKRKEENLATFNIVSQGLLATTNAITSLNDQLYANDLENLKQMREDGYLTEKQYNDRVKALRLKQFEENKKFSLAQAIIATAQAVVNALTIVPASAAPAAAFFAAATGALNIAKILSTEAPSFKKGTLNFQGGNVDADGGRLAVLHPREAVIPADRNADYHPTIKAVFNRQIKASEINGFVEARLKGKIPNSIDAKIDHRKLGQMLKGNNAVELTNAKMVGKVIAKELSKTMDIRRQ